MAAEKSAWIACFLADWFERQDQQLLNGIWQAVSSLPKSCWQDLLVRRSRAWVPVLGLHAKTNAHLSHQVLDCIGSQS